MGGVAISVQRSDWFLHTAADAICSTLYPNRSKRTRKKQRERKRERGKTPSIYFFVQEKSSSVWIFDIYFFFFDDFISVHIGTDIGKVFFSSRSQQQPNVYGRFFSSIDSFVRFGCMKVYCLQSGSFGRLFYYYYSAVVTVGAIGWVHFVHSLLCRSHDSSKSQQQTKRGEEEGECIMSIDD